MEHRRNLEMQFAGLMGQNIGDSKLASFSKVISGVPQLDVEESTISRGMIEQDRSHQAPAAIHHRQRSPSPCGSGRSPSVRTPVRTPRSRSVRRRRSSRSATRRAMSPLRSRRSRSQSAGGRSRRREYEEYSDRGTRRAYSSRSRSRHHRPAAEPGGVSERDLRNIRLVKEYERMKRENAELRAHIEDRGQLAVLFLDTHVCRN